MMPPKESAADTFRALLEKPAPSELVEFPRPGLPMVRLRVLNMRQINDARQRAHEAVKERINPEEFDTPIVREMVGDMVARELLAAATFTEDHKRIFAVGADLDMLRDSELAVLFTAWQMVQNKYGAHEGSLTTEEENAWVKRLAEGASAFPLSRCTWHQLVALIMSLSARCYSLSALLDSQFSTLPDTLKSDLRKWNIGTSSFGLRVAAASLPGLSLFASDDELDEVEAEAAGRLAHAETMRGAVDDVHPLDAPEPDQPITVEEAAELAKKLHNRE
jgi:hypothetical protein